MLLHVALSCVGLLLGCELIATNDCHRATVGRLPLQDWSQSKEDWASTAIYQNLTRTATQRRRGKFCKYTRADLLKKYADTELVDGLIARKEKEGLAWDHPDFPGTPCVATRMAN